MRLTALGLCLFAIPAAAKTCLSPTAAEAVAVRVLQSELTVAAIACRMPEPYAAFVDRQRPALQRYGATLIDHYAELHGEKQGLRAVDTLVTRLANQAATRQVAWTAEYCEFMRAVTARATEATPAGLGRFASKQPHARRLLGDDACLD